MKYPESKKRWFLPDKERVVQIFKVFLPGIASFREVVTDPLSLLIFSGGIFVAELSAYDCADPDLHDKKRVRMMHDHRQIFFLIVVLCIRSPEDCLSRHRRN